jgi:succinate dehydrogenase / fumarate reductase cytochrome b subunit
MAEGERVVRGALPVSVVVAQFLRSSVGAKVIMALTGFALWAFVIVHLIGNLQIFGEPAAINEYGVWLRELGHGVFVWVARAGLALAFVVHIAFGLRLAMLNRVARPIPYRKKKLLRSNLAAMSMATSGLLLLTFLVFHLAHTTWGLVLPSLSTTTEAVKFADGTPAHDVYRMMSEGFKLPWVVIIYIAGQVILLSHLIHGTASLWQSIGFHHSVWTPVISIAGRAIAALIVVLNLSMPLYFFFVGFRS